MCVTLLTFVGKLARHVGRQRDFVAGRATLNSVSRKRAQAPIRIVEGINIYIRSCLSRSSEKSGRYFFAAAAGTLLLHIMCTSMCSCSHQVPRLVFCSAVCSLLRCVWLMVLSMALVRIPFPASLTVAWCPRATASDPHRWRAFCCSGRLWTSSRSFLGGLSGTWTSRSQRFLSAGC